MLRDPLHPLQWASRWKGGLFDARRGRVLFQHVSVLVSCDSISVFVGVDVYKNCSVASSRQETAKLWQRRRTCYGRCGSV